MSFTLSSFDQLRLHMQSAAMECDSDRLRRAWETAEKAYSGKMHQTGVSVMEHISGVLQYLLDFHPDEESVIACLLHHTLECQYWTVSELEENFGPKVRELVSGVHLLSHVTLHEKRISVEDLKMMLLTVSEDIRTIVILLCDKLHIFSYADFLPKENVTRLARDVLQLFAPVAARLGMYALKHDLEFKAFPICYPQDAERITEQMEQMEHRHGDCMVKILNEVNNFLKGEGISAVLEYRTKHPYSAFRKMGEKGLTHIMDLYDYYALRVIVNTEAECYQVLGMLHRIARPVTQRFKDYIAFPKPNGYRSIHTTLAQLPGINDEDSFVVEVQVRTHEMHQEANFGIAAHWMYKEGTTIHKATVSSKLHDALALQVGTLDTDGLSDYIFVLTPKGNVVELPEGATPLDFAFQVHTDLGLSFRGARVNGSMVSLDYRLENGDIVEILKHKIPQPSEQWLQLLKMASSRSKLKRYMYAQKRPEYLVHGRELVNIELKKNNMPLLDTSLSVLRFLDGEKLSMQGREDVLMKIGQGTEKASSLFGRLGNNVKQRSKDEKSVSSKLSAGALVKSLVAEGDLNLPMRFAKCCKPESFIKEALIGVVGRRGQVVVHKKSCGMLRNANPDRKIRVWWE